MVSFVSRSDLPVDIVVFGEAEVVVRESGDEDDGLDLVKTPNPFLSFRPLTSHIKQSKCQPLKINLKLSGKRRKGDGECR
jgi:hypothetical protein